MVELSAGEAIAKIKMDESQLNVLQQQMVELMGLIEETKKALVTLKALPKEETAAGIPIGGGIILPGKLVTEKTVKVNLGAGVIIEKMPEEAISTLEKRVKNLEIEFRKIQESGQVLSNEAVKLKNRLSEYIRKNDAPDNMPVIG